MSMAVNMHHCLFPVAGRSRHPFRMVESTLGIETLPQQTGVYVPRRLSHVSGPVTGASGRRACDAMSLPLFARLVSCHPGALPDPGSYAGPVAVGRSAATLPLPPAAQTRASHHTSTTRPGSPTAASEAELTPTGGAFELIGTPIPLISA
jgi:hypothetical protein